MSKVHGKVTAVSLDGVDISQYCNNVEFGRTVDTHDTTTFGKNAKVYNPGLPDGTITIGGFYETIAVTGGPVAIIKPLTYTPEVVEFIHRPEGVGAGKPQDKVDVIVSSYTESSPVADMVTWEAELQASDEVDDTPQ